MIFSRVILRSTVAPIYDQMLASHLRLDPNDPESLFRAQDMARQAMAELEVLGNIAFLAQTVEATAVGPFDARHDFYMTYGPIHPPGVTSITVTAPLSDPITIPPAEYTVLPLNRPRVQVHATTPDVIGALAQPDTVVRITYRAGFGETAGDIPPDLQSALLNHVATLFDDVEHKGGTAGLSPHTARVLARYRGVRLA